MFLENQIAIKQIHIDFSKVTDMVLYGDQCDDVGKSEESSQRATAITVLQGNCPGYRG